MLYALSTAILAVAALISQSRGAILVPPPDLNTHDYKVAVSHFPLTDVSRQDPFLENQHRRVMVSVFMPVPKSNCLNECHIPYMPAQTARIADQQFLLNAGDSVFGKMDLQVCCKSSVAIDAAKYPVVVLDPHTDTSRLLYANLARYVSANGVVVVLIDHPGDSSIVEFPEETNQATQTVYNSGRTPLSNFSPIRPWNDTVTRAVDIRIQDINFALGQLNTTSILQQHFRDFTFTSPLDTISYSIVGHGLGGTVATTLSTTNPHIRFSINLSGTAPALTSSTAAPIYFIGRASFRRADDIHWPATWLKLTGPATELDLDDSEMFDFADLAIIVELANNEGGMRDVRGRQLGSTGAWANHAVKCFVEGIVRKELLADTRGVSKCVGMFSGMVPYNGRIWR